MTKQMLYGTVAAVGLAILGGQASSARLHASQDAAAYYVPPIVFQAAGPTVASIQSMVDAFRAALGANNGSAGPAAGGRREINWDGGGSTATSVSPTPFDGFLITRGARFETPGRGFVQAPTSGLAETFHNPSYAQIFTPFSPVRLFSAVESNITNTKFFLPGGGELKATTKGFGAVFTDVDNDGGKYGRRASTTMWFYGVDGQVLYKADVPASPGNGSLSFLGVLFPKADVARVRIASGNVKPGVDDGGRYDVVMMDDFIFGEPQAVPADKVHDVVDDVDDEHDK